MPRTVTVLDREKWAKRALLIDLSTLGVLVIVGITLIRASYTLGASLATASPGARSVNQLLLAVTLGVAALSWLAYRLVRNAYRELSRPF